MLSKADAPGHQSAWHSGIAWVVFVYAVAGLGRAISGLIFEMRPYASLGVVVGVVTTGVTLWFSLRGLKRDRALGRFGRGLAWAAGCIGAAAAFTLGEWTAESPGIPRISWLLLLQAPGGWMLPGPEE